MIIGLDGVTWDVLTDEVLSSHLPNLALFISGNYKGNIGL